MPVSITSNKIFDLPLDKHTSVDPITLQVATDIISKLNQYRDKKKGLRILSSKMAVHEKTLKRLLNLKNRPSYSTIYKIYRALFDTNNDTELLNKVPTIIKKEIEKSNPKKLDEGVNFKRDIEEEIRKDRVFCDIYLLAACGTITNEFIGFRFGTYGQEIIDKMLELEVLTTVKKNTYTLGKNQTNFSPQLIKDIGIHLVEQYSKPSKSDLLDKNFMAFFVEGLSEETYQEWLKIDDEAFRKKIKLTHNNNSKGNIKAFTYVATDTMK